MRSTKWWNNLRSVEHVVTTKSNQFQKLFYLYDVNRTKSNKNSSKYLKRKSRCHIIISLKYYYTEAKRVSELLHNMQIRSDTKWKLPSKSAEKWKCESTALVKKSWNMYPEVIWLRPNPNKFRGRFGSVRSGPNLHKECINKMMWR